MERIIERIRAERANQDKKWGEQNHDDFIWLAILSEEIGESAQAILECRNPNGQDLGMWHESDIDKELIQAAAVIVAWLEARVRRTESV